MIVVWADQAFDRLAEIRDYIARDDPEAADRHIDKLIARGDSLSEFPNLGRRLPELPRADLRELVEGNYRIVYRVREEAIQILTVFEGHRLLPIDDLPDENYSG
jgi:addiction module RelE/StbE family toxin